MPIPGRNNAALSRYIVWIGDKLAPPSPISKLAEDLLLRILCQAASLDIVRETSKRNKEYRSGEIRCTDRCAFKPLKWSSSVGKYMDVDPSRTAARISAVSKYWHNLFQDCVAEVVTMDDKVVWSRVSRTLGRVPQCCSFHRQSSQKTGEKVKRLVIMASSLDIGKQRDAIDALIECKSLKELVIDAYNKSSIITESSELLDRLASAVDVIYKSLETLKMSLHVNQRGARRLLSEIGRLVKLHSLCLRGGFRLEAAEGMHASDTILPELHSICCLNDIYGAMHTSMLPLAMYWDLPKLRFLHVRGGRTGHDAQIMMQMKCRILADIILEYHRDKDWENILPAPALKTLVLSNNLVARSLDSFGAFKNLHYVGITGHISPRIKATDLKVEMRNINTALTYFMDGDRYPALRRVQLLGFRSSRRPFSQWEVRIGKLWTNWVEMAKGREIAFVDRENKAITYL
ncbi:hypothetical protein SCHPADRAFT_885783 [Schizopora paradoxa]|uniref:Uncharacterized protein n=1 Tax=Schizopora paradoxa TaxID=27342 RepID=A0A0H2SAX0_9AGAM|nr:hypothetical protein SCHPADRAFT_885783 [Schizopora paradoxa]